MYDFETLMQAILAALVGPLDLGGLVAALRAAGNLEPVERIGQAALGMASRGELVVEWGGALRRN